MPATAGRVRMPANNRVHSSAALQTHGIWQSAIGYDPYAPNKDDSKNSSSQMTAAAEPDGENAYASFQGLLALARITGSNADEARGACKKCGRVGHLTFQCKNFVSLKESKEKDPEAIQAAVLNGLDKLKGGKLNGKKEMESEEEEDEESESSDSDVDSDIERIIAERSGKKVSRKGKKSLKKKKMSDEDDSSESDYGERKKKRGRSKKRSSRKRGISDSDDEDEGRRKRRKEKRKKRDDSSDEDNDDHRRHRKRKSRKEKRRRRSHRHSDDSESSDVSDDPGKRHRRKSQRHESLSDSDVSGSDDSRVGRGAKRSEKRSRKRHHEDDEQRLVSQGIQKSGYDVCARRS